MSYWWMLVGLVFFLGICCRLLALLIKIDTGELDMQECFRRIHQRNDCRAAGNFLFLAGGFLACILLIIGAIHHLK
jgi:hypothetical protein